MPAFTKQTAYGHMINLGRGNPGIALYPRFTTPTTYATAGVFDMTADILIGGLIKRDCTGGSRADLIPLAADIITAMGPYPRVGQSFMFSICNTSDASETITVTNQNADSTTTLSGVMTIAQNVNASFLCYITGSATVTIVRM